MDSALPSALPPYSKSAVAGFVCTLVGLLTFVFMIGVPITIVGLILAVVGVVQTTPRRVPRLRGRGYAVAALAICTLAMAVMALASGVISPN